MNRLLTACAVVLTIGAAAAAQDKNPKSTTLKSNDTRAVSMTGCLQKGTASAYELTNVIGGDLTARSQPALSERSESNGTRAELDRNKAKAKTTSKTSVDDRVVGTAGAAAVYDLTANEDIDLEQYVGKRIEIAAITPDPGKDLDVKVKSKPALPHLFAVSVRAIAPSCGY